MTMNHWYQSMYQMFEIFSDFIEAWLCYGFVGLFLPDRVRGKVPSFILSLLLVGSVRSMDTLGIDPMISTLWFVFYICMTTVVLFQVNLFYAVSLVSFYILCLYVINYFCMSVMGVIAGNPVCAVHPEPAVTAALYLSGCGYNAPAFIIYAYQTRL